MKRVVGSTGSTLLPSPEEAKLRVFQDVSNSVLFSGHNYALNHLILS